MVVEVGVVHGQVPPEQGSVGGEHQMHRHLLAAQCRNGHARHPLMEVSHQSLGRYHFGRQNLQEHFGQLTECHHLMQQVVVVGHRDVMVIP